MVPFLGHLVYTSNSYSGFFIRRLPFLQPGNK